MGVQATENEWDFDRKRDLRPNVRCPFVSSQTEDAYRMSSAMAQRSSPVSLNAPERHHSKRRFTAILVSREDNRSRRLISAFKL